MTRHNREPRLEEVPMIPLEQMTYDERLRFIEMVVWTPVEQRQSVLDRYGVSADCFMHLVQNENLTQLEVNAGRSCRAPIKTRTEEQVRKSLSMIQAALQERAVAATSVPDLVEDADVPADDAETEEIETADDIARELDLIEQQWDEEDRARGKEPAVSAAQAPAPVADSPPIEAAPVTHLFKLAPDEEAEFVFLETKLPTPSDVAARRFNNTDKRVTVRLGELLGKKGGDVNSFLRSFGLYTKQFENWVTRFSVDGPLTNERLLLLQAADGLSPDEESELAAIRECPPLRYNPPSSTNYTPAFKHWFVRMAALHVKEGKETLTDFSTRMKVKQSHYYAWRPNFQGPYVPSAYAVDSTPTAQTQDPVSAVTAEALASETPQRDEPSGSFVTLSPEQAAEFAGIIHDVGAADAAPAPAPVTDELPADVSSDTSDDASAVHVVSVRGHNSDSADVSVTFRESSPRVEHAEVVGNISLPESDSHGGFSSLRVAVPVWVSSVSDVQMKSEAERREVERKAAEALQKAGLIVKGDPLMEQAWHDALRAAEGNGNVLISAETGAGKEIFALAIHEFRNGNKKFRAINCAGLSGGVIESELFGHVKGAFTGAEEDRNDGAFQLIAKGGTLLLDEIGDMPLAQQAKLLRVLENREFSPVGTTKIIELSPEAKVIAATHQDLDTMVERGLFREDLLYRLRANEVRIPPLRDRQPEHRVALMQHFIESQQGFPVSMTPDAFSFFLCTHYAGNVRHFLRHLENAQKEAAMNTTGGAHIALEHAQLTAPKGY